jgi:hypothetical protein
MNKSLLMIAVMALTASTSAFALCNHCNVLSPVAGQTVLATDMNGNNIATRVDLLNMQDAFLVRKVKHFDKHNRWTREHSFRAVNQTGLYVPIMRTSTLVRADHNRDGVITHREARFNHPQIGLGWITPNGNIYVSRVGCATPVQLSETRYLTVP